MEKKSYPGRVDSSADRKVSTLMEAKLHDKLRHPGLKKKLSSKMKLGSDHQLGSESRIFWAAALRAAAVVARKSTGTEDELLEVIAKELRELSLSGAISLLSTENILDFSLIFLTDEDQNGIDQPRSVDLSGYAFNPEENDVFRRVVAEGEAIFCASRKSIASDLADLTSGPFFSQVVELENDFPLILAPLMLENEALGVIHVTADWLTEDDTVMMSALADHVAMAIAHLRSRLELQDNLKREKLRNKISQASVSGADIPTSLEFILELVLDYLGADAGAFALLDDKGETIEYSHRVGLHEDPQLNSASRGEGAAWRIINSEEPILIDDYSQAPDALQPWIEAGVKSIVGVPLCEQEQVIGALGIFSLDETRIFTEVDLKKLIAVSQAAEMVLNNINLYSRANRNADEANALMRGANSISASLDLEKVLIEITEQAQNIFNADGSRIHLLDVDRGVLRCEVALHTNAEEVMSIELKPGEGITGIVQQQGKPMLVNDPRLNPDALQVPGTPEDELETLALVPLKIRQRTMGVMTLLREGVDRPFNETDLELLSAFAAQAAVAIENAHLYGQIEAQALWLESEVRARTKELGASEARYRSLVENSLAGIVQTDLDGNIVYSNQASGELFNRPVSEIIGRPLVDFLAPRFRMMVNERFRARLRGDRPRREVYEVEIHNSDGEIIPVLLAVSLILDEEQTVQGVSALILDISRRKHLEAALLGERDRLSAILGSVGDAVVVTDAQGVIEYVNPAWERLNGFSRSEAVGESQSILRSEHQDKEFYSKLWSTISSGMAWRGELVNRRKNTTEYDAVLTITPVTNPDDEIINYVGVHHDISALKELDRLKSQFVSDVSHELRTPLTNIRLYLDLLSQTEHDPRAARYLKTLHRESERLANLIEDLLSLSRLESGAVPVYAKPVDFNEMLNALVEDRENLAAEKGLELRLETAAGLPDFMGDERLLGQVFGNLLTNAMSYTPSGGRILVSTNQRSDEMGTWITAEFLDTGLGVGSDEQPMIFERFFRGQASRSSESLGTGLGLSICKKIVELHGGRISLESAGVPGQGSRFIVWLPQTEILV
jgi:two-component system, OmpR family, phosphate regulon sensor histidine kinase PhoR